MMVEGSISFRKSLLEETSNENESKKDYKIRFPFTPPFSFVNNISMKLLNDVYYGLN